MTWNVETALTISVEVIDPPIIEELVTDWEMVESDEGRTRKPTNSKPIRKWVLWLEWDRGASQREFYSYVAESPYRYTLNGINDDLTGRIANEINGVGKRRHNPFHPFHADPLVKVDHLDPQRRGNHLCALTFWTDADDPQADLKDVIEIAQEVRADVSAKVEARLSKIEDYEMQRALEDAAIYEQQRLPRSPEDDKADSDRLAALLTDWNLRGGVTGLTA